MEVEKQELLTEIIGLTNKSEKECVPLIIKHIKEQMRLRAVGGHKEYQVNYGLLVYLTDPNSNGTPRDYCYPTNRLVDIACSYFKEQGFIVEEGPARRTIRWDGV